MQRSVAIVDAVSADQLGLPTPCAGWTLENLLGHMIAQHLGFAAAADGNTTDLSVWDVEPVGDDPASAYAAAAARVVDAFSAPDVLDRVFWLPEIRNGGPFPAATAIGFHLVDYVVHGWDVAASLGVDAGYEADLIEAALVIAARVPGGDARTAPSAAFAPAIAAPDDPSAMDRMLLMLGRSPSWPDPVSL